MIELTFQLASDVAKYKVEKGVLFVAGKNTNWGYIPLIDKSKISPSFISKLRRTKGEEFYAQWKDDLARFDTLSDEQIAEEVIKDLQKDGWRLTQDGRSN